MTKKFTLSQIYELLGPDDYHITDKKEKLVMIFDKKNDITRVFKVVRDYPLLAEEIIIDFEEMAERLAPGLDKVELLMEVLRSSSPNDVVDIKERLETGPDVSIKSGPGCFSLKIGGKRGRPAELVIRE